ncbi:MAG: ACP S-malonyltransferase [Planctomycetota bacterium]
MKIVFQFPGQSSRYPRMLENLANLSAASAALVEQASDLLRRDLARHYQQDAPDAYRTNRDIQIAVFLANHIFLSELERAGVCAVASLGLSLGEWNHLVHIGALTFEDALAAVDARGVAYDSGPPGALVAVFPIEELELESVVARARGAELLEIVSYNSPRQFVLGGESSAIARAARILEDERSLAVVRIEDHIAMHSTLFAGVAERFSATLDALPFATPRLSYWPNRLGRCEHNPSRVRFVELLATHVCRPVLWRTAIDHCLDVHSGATLVEVGPRSVLTNLLGRKWHPATPRFHTDAPTESARHLEEVIGALLAGNERESAVTGVRA